MLKIPGTNGTDRLQGGYPHAHSGIEMELLTSVGEMLSSRVMIGRLAPKTKPSELVLS